MLCTPSLLSPGPFPLARDSARQNVDPTGGVLPVLSIDVAALATATGAAGVTLAVVAGMTGLVTAAGSAALTAKEVAALAGLVSPSVAAAVAVAARISMAGLATPSGAAGLVGRETIALAGLAAPALQAAAAARAVITMVGLATAEGHALVITMPERVIDFAGLVTASLEAEATLGALPLPPDVGLPPRMGGRLTVPWRRDQERKRREVRVVYLEALVEPTLEANATLAIVAAGGGLAAPQGEARVQLRPRPTPVPAPVDLTELDEMLHIFLEAAA